MDYLVSYVPSDSKDAEGVLDKVVPRMAHSNPAVVLSAVKIVLILMDYVQDAEIVRNLCRRLAPNLVSLMSSEAEIQFIALKCINLIV